MRIERRCRDPGDLVFAFPVFVTYNLNAAGLDIRSHVVNTGEEILPACNGGHPALNCPLLPGQPLFSGVFPG